MNFEFDCDGFLTARRDELEAHINQAYGPLLLAARAINRDCHSLIFGADVRNRDPQALLVATLFLRILEHYQATLVLLGVGLVATAKATLRVLIETVFTLQAISSDESVLRQYVAADLVHRKKAINRAKNQNHASLTVLRESITADLIEDLEEEIKRTSAKEIKVEELSRKAGMHDWYVTAYALLSKSVHTQSREAEAYLKLDGNDEVRELAYGPSMEEIPSLALTASDCVLVAAATVDERFRRGFSPKLNTHRTNMTAAWERLSQ